MNIATKFQRSNAFSLIDLLVVLAILAVLFTLAIPVINRARAKSQRINCVNHLKNIGLASRIYATDHKGQFPQSFLAGSTALTNSNPCVRFFTGWSNELSTPLILVCPADTRKPAKDFATLSNSNLSYFVGLDADETQPQALLAGDRNLTNGTTPINGILILDPNHPVGWTHEMHVGQGNAVLGDGSVQQLNSSSLNGHTNRIAVPE